jgi:arsenite-transporting ATPase
MAGPLSRRLLLVTGKGGVGKTTVAAALAEEAASRGKRVLCAEVWTDATPSSTTPLMRAFGLSRIGDTPSTVKPNLDAVLLTPTQGQRQFLRQVLPRLLVDAALRAPGIRRFLAAAPALPEMALMYQLLELQRTGDGRAVYDVYVVDAPATGHALALAQIPALLLRVVPTGRVGETAREGLRLLTDAKETGVVAVTLPERLPVSETLELCAGLARHKVPMAAVVANRVPADPFAPEERAAVAALCAERPVAGAQSLRRLEAAQEALGRLRQAITVPLLTVPEVLEGSALTQTVAQALAAAGGAG